MVFFKARRLLRNKTLKEMKKIIVLVMATAVLTIFNGCQKEELNIRRLTDDEVQPPEVVKPDVYVENGYLVFKSQEVFDSTLAVVQNFSDDEFNQWENSLGFVSANSFYLKAEDEFSIIKTEKQKGDFIEKYSKYLKITEGFDEIDLKFYAKSMGDVLNIEGVIKIGTSLYLFTDYKEYVILDGDEDYLIKLKKGSYQKSGNKNIIEFDPFKNVRLKSTTDSHEFLVGGNIFTDYNNKRLDYSLERTLFTYVHSFDPYSGTYYYSCGYKLFLRLKQYYYDGSWKSDKISYWVNSQSLHWNGLIDGQVVQTYNGTFPDKSFDSTRNSVYLYYADQYFLTTNPNVSDMFIYDYTSTFRSNRLHDNGCGSCIFWKTITYQD